MTKEPLPTTHNAERGARSTCREESEIRPSLEASEHQHDCSGVQKIIWRVNMKKTARRNIMAIYEDRRIFRRILKRDLALNGASSQKSRRVKHVILPLYLVKHTVAWHLSVGASAWALPH